MSSKGAPLVGLRFVPAITGAGAEGRSTALQGSCGPKDELAHRCLGCPMHERPIDQLAQDASRRLVGSVEGQTRLRWAHMVQLEGPRQPWEESSILGCLPGDADLAPVRVDGWRGDIDLYRASHSHIAHQHGQVGHPSVRRVPRETWQPLPRVAEHGLEDQSVGLVNGFLNPDVHASCLTFYLTARRTEPSGRSGSLASILTRVDCDHAGRSRYHRIGVELHYLGQVLCKRAHTSFISSTAPPPAPQATTGPKTRSSTTPTIISTPFGAIFCSRKPRLMMKSRGRSPGSPRPQALRSGPGRSRALAPPGPFASPERHGSSQPARKPARGRRPAPPPSSRSPRTGHTSPPATSPRRSAAVPAASHP